MPQTPRVVPSIHMCGGYTFTDQTHSMTSSARSKMECGIASPSAFAVV